jgi:hypothetical protein
MPSSVSASRCGPTKTPRDDRTRSWKAAVEQGMSRGPASSNARPRCRGARRRGRGGDANPRPRLQRQRGGLELGRGRRVALRERLTAAQALRSGDSDQKRGVTDANAANRSPIVPHRPDGEKSTSDLVELNGIEPSGLLSAISIGGQEYQEHTRPTVFGVRETSAVSATSKENDWLGLDALVCPQACTLGFDRLNARIFGLVWTVPWPCPGAPGMARRRSAGTGPAHLLPVLEHHTLEPRWQRHSTLRRRRAKGRGSTETRAMRPKAVRGGSG